MTDNTAKIKAKGTESTGLTEDMAHKMHGEVGVYYMAIVELKVDQRHGPDAEGKRAVDLAITQLEVAERGAPLEAHLRELTRTVYQNRALNSEDQQLSIETQGDLERSTEDVIAAQGKALEPHEWTPVEGVDGTSGGPVTLCDVCSSTDQDDARHVAWLLQHAEGAGPDPDQDDAGDEDDADTHEHDTEPDVDDAAREVACGDTEPHDGHTHREGDGHADWCPGVETEGATVHQIGS